MTFGQEYFLALAMIAILCTISTVFWYTISTFNGRMNRNESILLQFGSQIEWMNRVDANLAREGIQTAREIRELRARVRAIERLRETENSLKE